MKDDRRVIIICSAVLISIFLSFAALRFKSRSEPKQSQSLSLNGGKIQYFKNRVEILSKEILIDRKYRSMRGPSDAQTFPLSQQKEPELLWITKYQVDLMDIEKNNFLRPEFICHSILSLDYPYPMPKFEKDALTFIMSSVQGSSEGQFPEGFGVPIMAGEFLKIDHQVLNLSSNVPVTIKHKATINYIRNKDLKEPLKPMLFRGASFIANKSGVKKILHWHVKPGREEKRANVTDLINIPFDTTLHYIRVHLHMMGESLELRDLTTGKKIFKSFAKNFADQIGIKHVDIYSSVEGIPIYKNHQYELVSIYNNTSNESSDAMAIMFLYMLDKESPYYKN